MSKFYEECTKEELATYINLCDEFFDGEKTPVGEGAELSIYGRLIKYAEKKNTELAQLRARIAELEKQLADAAEMLQEERE